MINKRILLPEVQTMNCLNNARLYTIPGKFSFEISINSKDRFFQNKETITSFSNVDFVSINCNKIILP
jgi:hypothetical protein